MTRRVLWGASIVLLCFAYRPIAAALRAGAGTAAHHACSSRFVSGLSELETKHELIDALLGRTARLLRIHIDTAAKKVEASLLYQHATAQFTAGFGCRLVFDSNAVPLRPRLVPGPAADSFAPLGPVEPPSVELAAALSRLFIDSDGARPRRVKALVIVKDGRVVAERYAAGFTVDTPLSSFSVAKSFTNALLGVLVRQGRIDMNAPAAVPEWSQPGDPRGKIRYEDLLRMASGLKAGETGSGFDPASQMFYDSNDMGAFAAGHPAAKPPGMVWEYTSCNTLILDRVISGLIGGGPDGFRDFAEAELFAPLGMRGLTLEFDGAGTFLGANHLYAPARSFARLGLLYLNDGVAPGGRRILPEGWTAFSRRSTAGSPYGAGFWTNDGPSDVAAQRVASGFPKDGFFASGNLGQRIYIIPSERMVIARFGYSQAPDFGIGADLDLIAAAIRALKG